MKIPALRAQMGDWTYYISSLTFQQVNDYISKVDDELHKSQSLKELIQRSITSNYLSIKDYILNQPEMFFNSLVLAVYNDYPDWNEIAIKYDNMETFQAGILSFPGHHKIFPVDGQHRVEGIKAALSENPTLANTRIGVIFIGHNNDESGMRRTRRLFSTLNRYAKPVTMDDTIALDEDDSIAIATRYLLEECDLFKGKRVTKSQNKAIPDNDKDSITSIITLYQCNKELLKLFRSLRKKNSPNISRDKIKFENYLKFRPVEEEIVLFEEFCLNFWTDFSKNITSVCEFNSNKTSDHEFIYRRKSDGGNLLFRPVGLLPFVQASIEIHKRKEITFASIFKKLNNINFTINSIPWRNIVWNPIEKNMIMGTSGIVKLFVIFLYGDDTIRSSEISILKLRYSGKLNIEPNDEILNNILIESFQKII